MKIKKYLRLPVEQITPAIAELIWPAGKELTQKLYLVDQSIPNFDQVVEQLGNVKIIPAFETRQYPHTEFVTSNNP